MAKPCPASEPPDPSKLGHLLDMPPVPQKLTPPKTGDHLITSSPSDHVLLLILNRPKALNSMTPELQDDIEHVLDWAETEPEVWYIDIQPGWCVLTILSRVVIITGTGRAFCAGQDLKGCVSRSLCYICNIL